MKSPLAIFVVWHPSCELGEGYSNTIFSAFNRDVTDPLSRGMGIPVFFRYLEPLLDIPDYFENVAVVFLIDFNFVNALSYEEFANRVLTKKSSGTIVLPVALDKTALNIGGKISSLNFVRLYENKRRADYLVATLSHEIARHLYSAGTKSKASPPQPLKLFISHAKADGVDVAKQIKAYIESEYAFKTFFDANDISIGYDFPQEIEKHVRDAAIIAVHSDKYASREWCRREVLLSKQYNRPIIILNCLKDGESRSFPYMANVRTVHYQTLDKQVWPRLLSATMQETLRIKFQELWLKYRAEKTNFEIAEGSLSAYPPELITVLTRRKTLGKTFVYPDPPLGSEEMAVLKEFDPTIQYLTPFCFDPDPVDRDSTPLTIGLSISECENMGRMGMGHAHLQDAMIEVARHLLNMGLNLAYGGDPNYRKDFNFTELLLQLALTYKSERPVHGRVFIHTAFPIYTGITGKKEAELKNVASIIKSTPQEFKKWETIKLENISSSEKKFLQKISGVKDHESRLVFAKCMTFMRKKMADAIDARIVIGGKLAGFKGKYPGILEETLTTLEAGKKVFVVDSMGGCAKMISDLVQGNNGKSDLEQLKAGDAEFIQYHNSTAAANDKIDYDEVAEQLISKKDQIKIYSGINTINLFYDLVK